MKKNFFLALTLLAVSPALASGLSIERFPTASVEDRFIVGPAKIEAVMNAGESKVFMVEVENRTGRTERYALSFEDFSAAEKEGQTIEFSGTENETSLKDTFSVEESSFELQHGERAQIPVSIFLPANVAPGGRFGAMIVSSSPTTGVSEAGAQARVTASIAVLFFVTVPGDGLANGALEDFSSLKVDGSRERGFRIVYRNDGTIHVNPYGRITVRSLFGTVVAEIPVDPYYVLPGSVRTVDIRSSAQLHSGFYQATVELNRGYEDIVDTRTTSFFVLRPGAVMLMLGVLVLAGYGIRIVRK